MHVEHHPASGCGDTDMYVHYRHRYEYLGLAGVVRFKIGSVLLFNTFQDLGVLG